MLRKSGSVPAIASATQKQALAFAEPPKGTLLRSKSDSKSMKSPLILVPLEPNIGGNHFCKAKVIKATTFVLQR